jgi:hypothetical protein
MLEPTYMTVYMTLRTVWYVVTEMKGVSPVMEGVSPVISVTFLVILFLVLWSFEKSKYLEKSKHLIEAWTWAESEMIDRG